MKFPDYPRSGQPVADSIRQIISYLRASRIVGINGAKGSESPNGTTFTIKVGNGGPNTSQPSSVLPCYFGELITLSNDSTESSGDVKTYIRGGNVKAGNKTWNLNDEPFEIDLSIDVEFPVWIKIQLTVNINSTNIATLSGVATSDKPTWESGASASDDYEDSVIPAAFPVGGSAAGTLIVPIGQVKVVSGAATLSPSGCGDITATYCPGTLDHYRGHASATSSEYI